MTTSTDMPLRITAADGQVLGDVDPADVRRALDESGAIALTGFGATLADFVTLGNAICDNWHDYRGGGFRFGSLDRRTVDTEASILTATGSTQTFPIPLHGEMYYFKERPGVLWFYCEIPPSGGGGETTVCDGKTLLDGLPPDVLTYLRANDLMYLRRLEAADWRQAYMTDDVNVISRICEANDTVLTYDAETDVVETTFVTPAIIRDPDGSERLISSLLPVWFGEQIAEAGTAAEILGETSNRTPPLVVRTATGDRIPAEIVHAVYGTGIVQETKVDWQPGDILAVNNLTTLHGRAESTDPDRLIYVRMGNLR